MSEQDDPSTIFHLDKEKPVSPIVFETTEARKTLGFSIVENPEEEDRASQFFNSTVSKTHIKNQDMSHTFIDEPEREVLAMPQLTVLEKNGEIFYEFLLTPDLRIITKSEHIKTIIGNGAYVEGLPVEHVLLRGKSEKEIDLMSLRRDNRVRNIFTFSDTIPNFSPEREYRGRSEDFMLPFATPDPHNTEGLVTQKCEAEVILAPFTTKNEEAKLEWNYDLFDLVVLHENGHAANDGVDGVDQVSEERGANALTLQTVRSIIRQFPDDTFFDPKDMKEKIRRQLVDGYGQLRAPVTPVGDGIFNQEFIHQITKLLRQKIIVGKPRLPKNPTS